MSGRGPLPHTERRRRVESRLGSEKQAAPTVFETAFSAPAARSGGVFPALAGREKAVGCVPAAIWVVPRTCPSHFGKDRFIFLERGERR